MTIHDMAESKFQSVAIMLFKFHHESIDQNPLRSQNPKNNYKSLEIFFYE